MYSFILEEFMKKQIEEEKLRLIVFKSALELGQKVDECLLDMYQRDKEKETFIVPLKENFFEDGHLKVEIDETRLRYCIIRSIPTQYFLLN